MNEMITKFYYLFTFLQAEKVRLSLSFISAMKYFFGVKSFIILLDISNKISCVYEVRKHKTRDLLLRLMKISVNFADENRKFLNSSRKSNGIIGTDS